MTRRRRDYEFEITEHRRMNDVPSLQQEYPACSFSETPHHSPGGNPAISALNNQTETRMFSGLASHRG
ncbi:MAG: hypothetical protein H6939_07745 [Burkholderiales bacterium]|nr:hypothetical protein [Burkholderiales bacterium]